MTLLRVANLKFLFLIMAAVFFSSFAEEAPAKFSITYPDGWKVSKLPNGTALAIGPDENGMHASISVATIQVGATPLKDLVEPNLKTMAASLQNFAKKSDEELTIAGQKARKVDYTFTGDKGKAEQTQYWVVINQNLFFVTCSSAEVNFEKYKKAFDDSVRTLKAK